MLASLVLFATLVGAQEAAPPVKDPQGDLPKVAHQKELDGDVKAGANYSKEVEKEYKLSTDEKAIARVQRIGNELAAIANHNMVKVTWGDKRLNPYKYSFKVVEGEDVNAFSLPGGFIYVYEGLIKFAESDDELAGVLAHEIAHASFRHVATMERKSRTLDALTLPLILISIFGGGSETTAPLGSLGQLVKTSSASGWSVDAERASDYGAVQYMMKSPYNPVGMLTFMERLAKTQRQYNVSNLGIFQTHPPSKERAETLMDHLENLNIPIRRSLVSPAYRVNAIVEGEGAKVMFEGRQLVVFAGPDADERARSAAISLNEFFDTVPDLFEVTSRKDGEISGRGRLLFSITAEDAKAAKKDLDDATKSTLDAIKRSLYSLAYRVWDTE